MFIRGQEKDVAFLYASVPLFIITETNQERRNGLFIVTGLVLRGQRKWETSVAKPIVFTVGRPPRPVITWVGGNT